jgi:hypothetical protein
MGYLILRGRRDLFTATCNTRTNQHGIAGSIGVHVIDVRIDENVGFIGETVESKLPQPRSNKCVRNDVHVGHERSEKDVIRGGLRSRDRCPRACIWKDL